LLTGEQNLLSHAQETKEKRTSSQDQQNHEFQHADEPCIGIRGDCASGKKEEPFEKEKGAVSCTSRRVLATGGGSHQKLEAKKYTEIHQ